MTIRVLVADDQSMVRAGFRMLLSGQEDIEVVAEAVARRTALAVVSDLDPHLVRPIADGHIRVAGARVFERVGQAFLNNSIGREIDPPWERVRLPVDVQLDGEACAAYLFQQ